MSLIMDVPPPVPLLDHSSRPLVPLVASNHRRSFHTTNSRGADAAMPGFKSITSDVPPGVPSDRYNSPDVLLLVVPSEALKYIAPLKFVIPIGYPSLVPVHASTIR